MTEDGWDEVVTGPPISSIKKPEQKKGYNLPQQYKFDRQQVKPLKRIESSVLPNGYIRGTHIGLIGVPGCGKSRYAIQEVLLAAKKGYDCLYLYNESSRPHFDNYIMKIADELKVEISSHITFADMSEFILKIADYQAIENFFDKMWVQQARYWLTQVKNPGIIAVDSFSNIGRRYIPQLFESHQAFITGLTDLYSEIPNPPITLEIHQKSGSNYDRDTDSVVGGFSVVHQLDMTLVFKMKDINVWDAKRYNMKEGTLHYFLQCTKDRFSLGDFEQTEILLKNGKLELGRTTEDITIPPKLGEAVDWSKEDD